MNQDNRHSVSVAGVILDEHGRALLIQRRDNGQPVSGTLTVTDESQAFRWVASDTVASLASEAFAVRVLDAMRQREQPAVRQHDGVHLIGSTTA